MPVEEIIGSRPGRLHSPLNNQLDEIGSTHNLQLAAERESMEDFRAAQLFINKMSGDAPYLLTDTQLTKSARSNVCQKDMTRMPDDLSHLLVDSQLSKTKQGEPTRNNKYHAFKVQCWLGIWKPSDQEIVDYLTFLMVVRRQMRYLPASGPMATQLLGTHLPMALQNSCAPLVLGDMTLLSGKAMASCILLLEAKIARLYWNSSWHSCGNSPVHAVNHELPQWLASLSFASCGGMLQELVMQFQR